MTIKAHIKPAPAIQAWTFSVRPYVWATSLSGSTTIKSLTTNVDASFFDILKGTFFNSLLLAKLGTAARCLRSDRPLHLPGMSGSEKRFRLASV